MTLYVTLRIVQDIILEGMRQKLLFNLAILPCLILRWFKFLFRTNFTSHFFSLCSIFFKGLIKKRFPLLWIQTNFTNPLLLLKLPCSQVREGSSISNVRKSFRKTKISYRLIRTRTCVCVSGRKKFQFFRRVRIRGLEILVFRKILSENSFGIRFLWKNYSVLFIFMFIQLVLIFAKKVPLPW